MTINTYVVAAALVFGAAFLSVLGLLGMRKVVAFERLRHSHEVSGYLLSVVGTIYAVLLGLVVIDAMQHYQTARDITQRETSNLVDVFLLSESLPEPAKSNIKTICSEYADRVIDVEWGQMKDGSYCPVARSMAMDLMRALITFEPKTENEKALYPQLVQEASQFWQNRQMRVDMAARGLPPLEWITLLFGAVITIFFTYFFGLENVKLQIVMTAMVTMLIALNLVLVLFFARPFSGDMSVQADSFRLIQGIFKPKPESSI